MQFSRVLLSAFALLGLVCLMSSFAPTALAASIVVNSTSDDSTGGDNSCTLREAIKNANAEADTSSGDCAAGSGNDTITFSVSGTITLDSVLPTLKTAITILGPGPTLDGNGNSSILRVNSPSGTVTVTSMNFSNGVCDSSRNGGGAITSLSKLKINGGVFSNNDAGDCDGGGAILSQAGGILRVNGTQFTGNSAGSGSGGAILNLGVLSITNNSKFTSNQATNGGAFANLTDGAASVNQAVFRDNSGWSYGGAIYNTGAVYLDLATLDDNDTGTSGYGGAIANLSGTVEVANSTLLDGWAKRGGGIYSENGTVKLTGVLLFNNRGWGSGGGIYDTGGTLILTNSTMTQNNTAGEYGGAIYTELGQAFVTNSTLAANTCVCPRDYGAGGILAPDSVVTLKNSILANWWGDGNNYDCTGYGFIADAYNKTYDDECDAATQVTPYTLLLGDLKDHGGPTLSMKPNPDSVALDVGDDAVCADAVGYPNYGAGGVDQRGISRPQGVHCDVGAYEVRK